MISSTAPATTLAIAILARCDEWQPWKMRGLLFATNPDTERKLRRATLLARLDRSPVPLARIYSQAAIDRRVTAARTEQNRSN